MGKGEEGKAGEVNAREERLACEHHDGLTANAVHVLSDLLGMSIELGLMTMQRPGCTGAGLKNAGHNLPEGDDG